MPYNLTKPNASVVTVADSAVHFPDQENDKKSHLSSTINEEHDSLLEKKLVRRLDWHIMPLFSAFYFVDYLDRANMAGLQTDLNMTSTELNTAISAFFYTYILFQVPSNMVLKRIGSRWWLSSIMLVWGITTLCMAFTRSFPGLLVARLVLGAAESGYVPGILYQMSRIYKPQELGFRVAILLGMAAISGIASGPIAYGASILGLSTGRLAGWQCIFLVEGAPTIALALLSYVVLFNHINDVGWLTEEEKMLQNKRMASVENAEEEGKIPSFSALLAVMRDKKSWLFSAVFFLNSINITSIVIFAPILIHGFGFSVLNSQLMTAPPCLMATLLTIVCGWIADRGNRRAIMVVVGGCVIGLGFLLLLVIRNVWGLYAVIFIIAAGIGAEGPIGVSWSAINYPDLSVRAIAVAFVTMIGNVGSIAGSYLYSASDPSQHAIGNIINLACALASAVIAGLTGYLMYRENCRRDRAARHALHGFHDAETEEDNKFRYFY